MMKEIIEEEDAWEKGRKERLERQTERNAEFEKTHPEPTPEEIEEKIQESAEKELQEIKEGDDDWTIEEIKEEFSKKRDLRKVFRTLLNIEPAMVRNIMEERDWTKNRKETQVRNMLELLQEFKFIERVPILEIWVKDYAINGLGLKADSKTELTEREKLILDKFNKWTETMNFRTRFKYIGVSSYWFLTEFGLKNAGCLKTKTNRQ